MKPGVQRQRAEYIRQLAQQLAWIERSAAAYDDGSVDEAIRIATHVRTLLYDKGSSSVSLLTYLGIKKTARFLSTITPQSSTSEMWAGFTRARIGECLAYADYVPKLAGAEIIQNVPFDQWWHNDVVYARPDLKVCRRDLVLWAANKDGGAHVDEIVPEAYRWLEKGAGIYLTHYPDDAPARIVRFDNAHLSALRQLAYEVLNTQDLRNVK